MSSPSSTSSVKLPLGIQHRFDAILKTELKIQSLITNLKSLTSAHSVNLPPDSSKPENVSRKWQDWGNEIRSELKMLSAMIEELQLLTHELPKQSERFYAEAKIKEHQGVHQQATLTLRQVTVQHQSNLAKAERLEREQLLGGATGGGARRRKHLNPGTDDETLLKTATDVTSSLRRMTQLMNVELEKSAANISALEQQSSLLLRTHSQHQSLSTLLRSSGQFIIKLQQRDWTDKLLIVFALSVFTLVTLWILKKRVWGTLMGAVGDWW